MFIGIDIGNTNIVIGIFKKESLVKILRIAPLGNFNEIINSFLTMLYIHCKLFKKMQR